MKNARKTRGSFPKRVLGVLMALVFVANGGWLGGLAVEASQQLSEIPISVYVHGERVIFPDQQPVIIDGNTLVPIRGVFDALGFQDDEISWDGEEQAVYIFIWTYIPERDGYGHMPMIITIGSRHLYAYGELMEYALAVPAQIIGGRTMIPLRAPLEAMGYELEWVGETRTILITRPTTESRTYRLGIPDWGLPTD